MAERPIIEELLGPVLDRCECVLARQRQQRLHRADTPENIVKRGENHHFGKADAHMVRMGPDLEGFDEDDQVPHVILAVLRLMMTALCVLRRAEKETT